MSNPRGQARLDAIRRYRKAHPGKRICTDRDRQNARERYQEIKASVTTCYLRESRAILAGKDVRGRNKCVKLPGD